MAPVFSRYWHGAMLASFVLALLAFPLLPKEGLIKRYRLYSWQTKNPQLYVPATYPCDIDILFLGSSNIGAFPSSSLHFAFALLLEHGVSVVPGSAYGASTERFVRLSVGTESEDRIRDAILAIKRLVDSKQFDKENTALQIRKAGLVDVPSCG